MAKRTYTDADKAAIVLLSLGEELAATIMSQMSQREILRISSAMSQLGRIDQEAVDTVMLEFYDKLTSTKTRLEGNAQGTRQLLAAAMRKKGGDEDEGWLDGVVDLATPAMVDVLDRLDAKGLSNYLRNEHPQTIALVLAHAGGKKSGDVLKLLPESLHVEVIRRIATLEAVDPEVIHELADDLRQELDRVGRQSKTVPGGAVAVAAMMNTLTSEAAQAQLKSLEERDPTLAEQVRALMFTFADLVKLDDRGIQELLRVVTDQQLMLALKAAPTELAERLYKNMSSRKAERLREDVANLGMTKKSDVEAAQRAMAELARKLLDEGRIELIGA